MSIPQPFRTIAFALAVLACPAAGAMAASTNTITVLATASALPGAKALAADFTQKTGVTVKFAGGSRFGIRAAIKAGQGDVVLLPSTDFADLPQVLGMTPIGHILVGVGVKAGTPVPDVSTPEKFRAALVKAKGVAYADPVVGTSAGPMIQAMLNQPDFKTVRRVPVQGLAVTGLASGRADIALQLVPELANTPQVVLAGPVPYAYGASVDFSAGMVGATLDSLDARAFIVFLTSHQAVALWKANGLESLIK
jgi:molybdate transport system substrate-binding protein